ncbi:zinc finger protein 567-like [Ostrinia nubilalis]
MNKHTLSKMYTCDTCGRSFTTSTVLKQHMVTHTGERKYVCSLCGKRFTQNGSLSLHVRTFHLKQPYPKRNRKTTEKDDDDAMAMSAACSKAFGPKYVPSMYPWVPPK